MFQRLIQNVRNGACAGTVAVEFALIAPVLILIFFATIELAQLLDCRTRVIDATASAADLIAQGTSIDSSGISAMRSAIGAIIYPYTTSTSRLKVVISSISCTTYEATRDSTGSTTESCTQTAVDWSKASGNGARTLTSVPSDLSTSVFTEAGAGVVMVEVTYTYSSPTAELLGGDVSLHWTAYSIPRLVTAVTYSDN